MKGETTMTFSDKELDKRIAHNERMLLKVKPGSWTAQKIQESLDNYRQQRALPRNERCQYRNGTL